MAAKTKTPALPATAAGGTSIAQRVRAANRWRDHLNPLRGLTMVRAVQFGEAYLRGEMADVQWLFFWLEQSDADLLALIELRLGRLLEMEYKIQAAEDADEALAQKQSEFLRTKFDAIENLYEAIEHLALAPFRGFAHCEKLFAAGEIVRLEIVDQWNVVRDGLIGGWKYNPDARSTSYPGLPEENIMPREQFVSREVRRPINRLALFKAVRAGLCEKDWDAFCEIYGIPGGVVIGPPNVPTDKEAEYQEAAEEVSAGASGYLPNGSDFKANTAARGSQPFKERLDHLSEKLVLAGTAGKLTMLTDATGLGSGASDAHGQVFDTIAAAEARRISEIFNKQLVESWLDAAFPNQPHVAYFVLAANEETDVAQIIVDIQNLATAGYQVPESEVQERTGYAVVLKPPPAAAPFAGGFPRIGNRDGAAPIGRDAIFKANAAASELAARRPVFRPIAEKLAALYAAPDEATFRALAAGLKAGSADLYAAVLAQAPDLARPAEAAIGAALVSGFAEAAAARQIPAPAPKTAPSIANRAPKPATAACKGRARPSHKQ